MDKKDQKRDKRVAILKRAGGKLGYYGIKYAVANTALGASMTNTGMVAMAGMISLGPVGAVIAVGFIIGMICFTMRKTKKGVVNNTDYETMLEDSAKYERRVEEQAQLDKQELINNIFNEDTYSEIKKGIPKDRDNAFLATYIGTEYGKLLLELYAKELFNKKKNQVGGGVGLVDDMLNNIDTHESSKSEQPNEIIAKIYEMFEVDIADNTGLFYKAVTDEILVLFPLLYQNTKKKKVLSNFVNPNDLRLNTLCGLRLTELNTKIERRRQNLELIYIPKKVIIDDPKPIDDTYFDEWSKNPSSSKNYYSLSFKNAIVKKRDFYLSILKNRYDGEVKQILKFGIVTPPEFTAKTFSDKIEFFKKLLSEYDEILVNKKKEKISEITDKADSELFIEDPSKGKKKLVIDENGKIGGKYPYYTVDILAKGTYKVASIDKEKVILQDNIIILINPKDKEPSRKIINEHLMAELDIKFTNIRALYSNIKSRENYLDISNDINTIYTELENTQGDDNIRALIARFKVINDNIKGNNSKYTDKHNADVERKKTLISSIGKDEDELKILTEGCEVLKQKSLDFYMDKDKKIYTKVKGNIKYIENIEKQHKELVKFITEASKSLNKSSIKNKVKRLSINAALLKGQAELDQNINSIGDIIPDINRIALKLQFYESEKMAKNMLKASLINNGLKIEMINYIYTELEKLEAIIYSSKDSPIFDDSLFKEKVQLLKIAPFDINAAKKGDEITITERDGVFNVNDELIEYNVLKTKQIIFIRHGNSQCNSYKGTISQRRIDKNLLDSALTPFGRTQAENLRKELWDIDTIDLVLSSPLSRAMETASIIFKDKKVKILDILAEVVGGWGDVGQLYENRLYRNTYLKNIVWDNSNKNYGIEDRWEKNDLWNFIDEGEFKDARPYESNESAKQRIHLFWKWIANYTEGRSRIAVGGHSKLFGRIENDYGILLSRAKLINREFKNCEMVEINFN